MGVFARVVLYQTDRGEVMTIEEMESSHLLNAIKHHQGQIATLLELVDGPGVTKVEQASWELRAENLLETVQVLATALATRNVDDEAPTAMTRRQFESLGFDDDR